MSTLYGVDNVISELFIEGSLDFLREMKPDFVPFVKQKTQVAEHINL